MSFIVWYLKKHIVTSIALALALISMVFVPPSLAYLDYIDVRTLCCLFCILAVVEALTNVGFFESMAHRVIKVFKTTRSCVMALVWVTLIGAMFMTNDVALLTFLPLSYLVLSATDNRKVLPWTFVLQNAAAILGGMILPFGNPHNLYLYNRFEIPTGDFVLTMLPTFIAAIVLITLATLVVKPAPLKVPEKVKELPRPKTAVYFILFGLTMLFVLRLLPFFVITPVVGAVLLMMDRQALKKVDYSLLLTFIGFFIFAGNMSAIPEVKDFLVALLSHNALLTEVLTSQIISNLPTTLLIAPFTSDWATLLVATDIAGVGTPIASLASLITIMAFMYRRPKDFKLFMKMFLGANFSLLLVLYIVAWAFL